MTSGLHRRTFWQSIASGLCAAVVSVLVALAVAVPPAHAQALYGSIVGTVTDSTDAAVPGATVTVVQTQTNQERSSVTTTAGVYSFPAIPSGTYTVTIALPGFQTVTRRNVAVSISTAVRVDVKLQVSGLSETVSVNAQTATLQTDRAEVRGELATKSLEELPVPPNRNYQNLLVTIPGFTPPRMPTRFRRIRRGR